MLGEKDIIAYFYQDSKAVPLRNPEDMDDCSVLPTDPKGLVTTDSMVEDVHFRLDWSSPEDIAVKLFHVNLSDLLSSGGRPYWSLLNLGMPKAMAESKEGETFIQSFASALQQECRRYSCPLIGGDSFCAAKLFLTFTMGGQAERYIERKGASPSDHLYLSGNIGLSLAGLKHLQGLYHLEDHFLHAQALAKHLQPQAHLEWAQELWQKKELHAMIDISDGLLRDAVSLAQANHLDLYIELDSLPMEEGLQPLMKPEEAILSGEELELLFLASPELKVDFPCAKIGYAKAAEKGEAGLCLLRGEEAVPLPPGAFEHF